MKTYDEQVVWSIIHINLQSNLFRFLVDVQKLVYKGNSILEIAVFVFTNEIEHGKTLFDNDVEVFSYLVKDSVY